MRGFAGYSSGDLARISDLERLASLRGVQAVLYHHSYTMAMFAAMFMNANGFLKPDPHAPPKRAEVDPERLWRPEDFMHPFAAPHRSNEAPSVPLLDAPTPLLRGIKRAVAHGFIAGDHLMPLRGIWKSLLATIKEKP